MKHCVVPCHVAPHPLAGEPEKCAYFDLISDGHFWRTSQILSAVYTVFENGAWVSHLFSADPDIESDEFELLEEMVPLLRKEGTLYTFNGTSFILPYLANKLKAYDLPNPWPKGADSTSPQASASPADSTAEQAGPSPADSTGSRQLIHRDFYRIYKPLYYLLRLPSRRMEDYLRFAGCDSGTGSDADDPGDRIPALTRLLPCLIFPGSEILPDEIRPALTDFRRDGDYLYIGCSLPFPVPRKSSYQAGPYYLIADGSRISLSAAVERGAVRRYFPDYKNYAYLPEEGYAVHRSVASFIPKERQVPADKDTCFTYVKITDELLSDPAMQEAYLASVRAYIYNTIH